MVKSTLTDYVIYPFPLIPTLAKGGWGGFSRPYLQLFLECSFHHKVEARTAHDGRIPERNHTIGNILRFVIVGGIWLDGSDLLGHFSTQPMMSAVPLFPNVPAYCSWRDQDFQDITG
jgi:hypothetical protein